MRGTNIVRLTVNKEIAPSQKGRCQSWFYSRGAFKGFKTHLSVNQLGLPLKVILTTGNKHDSPFLPELLVSCELILADAGYALETNRKACRKIKAKPIIAKNRRRDERRFKTPMILKKKR